MSNKKKKRNVEKDFKKIKLKVGRRLKKATSTDTNITARRLVLIEQLKQSVDQSKDETRSHRGLTVPELCRQLGHPSTSTRRGAVIDLGQLIKSDRRILAGNLHLLVPSIGRLLSHEGGNKEDEGQLRALFSSLFSIDAMSMMPHSTLLLAHVLRALSHLELAVRSRGLVVLVQLLEHYPDLYRDNGDLYRSFLLLLTSPRQPSPRRLLPAISSFIQLFTPSSNVNMDRQPRCEAMVDTTNSTRSFHISLMPDDPFDFPVMSSSGKQQQQQQQRPLERIDGVLELCTVLCPRLAMAMSSDGVEELVLTVLKRLIPVVNGTLTMANESERSRLKLIWRPLRSARCSDRRVMNMLKTLKIDGIDKMR